MWTTFKGIDTVQLATKTLNLYDGTHFVYDSIFVIEGVVISRDVVIGFIFE